MLSKGKILGIVGIFGIIAMVGLWTSLAETVRFGSYHIKQAAISGTMTVKNNPGIYGKIFGDITIYPIPGEFNFNDQKVDEDSDFKGSPLSVSFQGNSTAKVSGFLKYRLSSVKKHQLNLHKLYSNPVSIKSQLIKNAVRSALKQTGPMFTPEEAFITKRAEFTDLVRKQLENGLYATITKQIDRVSDDKQKIKQTVTSIKLDTNGKEILERSSVLSSNGIIIEDFVITDFDFDKLTDGLIKKKKEAEQLQVVARANADKAKQDAITVEQEGLARIAKARADEEVEKIIAVTQAERERDVAKLEALQAKEFATKIKLEGEAKAYSAKLKVQAGLTPKAKAEFDMKTKIGVARELAKWVGPRIVMSGSGSGGGASDAFMIRNLMEIQDKFSEK